MLQKCENFGSNLRTHVKHNVEQYEMPVFLQGNGWQSQECWESAASPAQEAIPTAKRPYTQQERLFLNTHTGWGWGAARTQTHR